MNIRYTLLLAAFVLITVLSCDKPPLDGPTIVDGTIIEKGSSQPIQGVTVHLMKKDQDSFMGYSWQIASTTITNANGEFYFEYEEEPGYQYGVEATKAKYLETEMYYPKK